MLATEPRANLARKAKGGLNSHVSSVMAKTLMTGFQLQIYDGPGRQSDEDGPLLFTQKLFSTITLC